MCVLFVLQCRVVFPSKALNLGLDGHLWVSVMSFCQFCPQAHFISILISILLSIDYYIDQSDI